MERRDFLKILGLGGVALTLPKPMSVVAAKLSDFVAPPLHVGRCEIGPMSDAVRTFTMHEIGVGVEPTIPLTRHIDYSEKWDITMFLKRRNDPASRVLWWKQMAAMMPDPNKSRLILSGAEDDRLVHTEAPCFYHLPRPMILDERTVVEFWWAPSNLTTLPKHPLPHLQVALRGAMFYNGETDLFKTKGGRFVTNNPKVFWWTGEVQTLQLERAKAIELGIVSPAEPEGIIV